MQRTYLFVPPEEKSEVQTLGALWDADSKRWYVHSDEPLTRYARWLPEAEHYEEFAITSADAYVAAANTSCRQCGSAMPVVCIHCKSGTVFGDPLRQFTVSDISSVSDELRRQLAAWPNYRPAAPGGPFANHCPRCGVALPDLYLHSEPGEPFFDIPGAPAGSIELTPLAGTVELTGDEHFRID